MKLKQKIQNLVSPLYNKVWHGPKGRFTAKLKKACDDLPRNQRLMVVTILLSVFILTAFFVFGNACYKMGARQAHHEFKIEHIESIPMPEADIPPIDKLKAYEAMESEMMPEKDVEPLDTATYETD